MPNIALEQLASLLKVDGARLLDDVRKLAGIQAIESLEQPLTADQCEKLAKYLQREGVVDSKTILSKALEALGFKKKKTLKLKSGHRPVGGRSVSLAGVGGVAISVKSRLRNWSVQPESQSEGTLKEDQKDTIQSSHEEAPSQAVSFDPNHSSDKSIASPEAPIPVSAAVSTDAESVAVDDSSKPSSPKKKSRSAASVAEKPAAQRSVEDGNGAGKRSRRRIKSSQIRQRDKKDKKGKAKDLFDQEQELGALKDMQVLSHGFEKPVSPVIYEVEIPEYITVSKLAMAMSVKVAEVIKVMMKMGVMATINQPIDQDTAVLVVEEMGHKPKPILVNAVEASLELEMSDAIGEPVPRAPVVTIVGHVDHGKTTLLDYIRNTRVTVSEAGGITQHMGAYHVMTAKGMITFLDTPGHEAFTAMRARGVKCTDIVVLVVAADDGVKPQTVEAIQHAKAAKAPVIVAINKMDISGADPEVVKSGISQHGLVPESWGGEVMCIPISAKTGKGVDDLLEAILLQAEVSEFKAVSEGPARGVVIESRLDRGRGSVATLLVQSGCLKKGDVLIAGAQYGRVRAMIDSANDSINQAGPSMPVKVLGLSGLPEAGDEFLVVSSERKAKEVSVFRQNKSRETKFMRQRPFGLDTLFSKSDKSSNVRIVLKADTQGSLEAIRESLTKLNSEKVSVEIISAQVGGISESDVHLSTASDALLIGFNVRADAVTRRLIERERLDVRYYSIIYELISDVEQLLEGIVSKKSQEKMVGLAEVREVFRSSKFGAVAGCLVLEGVIKRNCPIRVLRDNVVVYEGDLESLRRFKEDVDEVHHGNECGIGVKGYRDIKVGDQIESYAAPVK